MATLENTPSTGGAAAGAAGDLNLFFKGLSTRLLAAGNVQGVFTMLDLHQIRLGERFPELVAEIVAQARENGQAEAAVQISERYLISTIKKPDGQPSAAVAVEAVSHADPAAVALPADARVEELISRSEWGAAAAALTSAAENLDPRSLGRWAQEIVRGMIEAGQGPDASALVEELRWNLRGGDIVELEQLVGGFERELPAAGRGEDAYDLGVELDALIADEDWSAAQELISEEKADFDPVVLRAKVADVLAGLAGENEFESAFSLLEAVRQQLPEGVFIDLVESLDLANNSNCPAEDITGFLERCPIPGERGAELARALVQNELDNEEWDNALSFMKVQRDALSQKDLEGFVVTLFNGGIAAADAAGALEFFSSRLSFECLRDALLKLNEAEGGEDFEAVIECFANCAPLLGDRFDEVAQPVLQAFVDDENFTSATEFLNGVSKHVSSKVRAPIVEGLVAAAIAEENFEEARSIFQADGDALDDAAVFTLTTDLVCAEVGCDAAAAFDFLVQQRDRLGGRYAGAVEELLARLQEDENWSTAVETYKRFAQEFSPADLSRLAGAAAGSLVEAGEWGDYGLDLISSVRDHLRFRDYVELVKSAAQKLADGDQDAAVELFKNQRAYLGKSYADSVRQVSKCIEDEIDADAAADFRRELLRKQK